MKQMFEIYFKLFLIALLTVVVALVFYFLEKKTKFGKLKYSYKQIIIGIVFGGLAIIGTEFGVLVENGATANARDAAPLIAGLVFGGPAGIIAGLIGGIERFFAAYWGKGMFTQIACTVSTAFAGIYAALLRKFMFENKRPTWGFAIAISTVMEVLHLTMVFITHFDDPVKVMGIIKIVSLPMIFANVTAVFLTCLILQIVNIYKNREAEKTKYYKISTQVQLWLLVLVVFGYVLSTSIVYAVQTGSANQEANETISLNINDVKDDVLDSSNSYLIGIGHQIKNEYEANRSVNLKNLLTKYNVSEINIVKNDGTIEINKTSFDLAEPFNMVTDGQEQSRDLHNTIQRSDVTEYAQEFQLKSDNTGVYCKYAAIKLTDPSEGYIAVGLYNDLFKGVINDKINEITNYRHIMSTGFILIFNSDGEVVSNSDRFEGKEVGLTIDYLKSQQQNKRIEHKIYGIKCSFMFVEKETYYLVVAIPEEEIFSNRDSLLYLNSFMEVIVFAILFALIYFLLKVLVVNKIEKVNNSLGKIINGDLNEKVNITSSIEFASLSHDINITVETLKKYIDEAAKRIDDELAFAKTIQLSAMPMTFPAFPDRKEFDLYASMDTAKEVGGDFYDFYIISKNELAFLIADVSGKGIPAAMFMMESKAMLKNLTKMNASPEKVMEQVNDSLCQNNKANMFVTCWLGILNLDTGHIRFANAGHNNPLIYRKGKGYQYIEQKKNLVLGAMEGVPYKLQELDLNKGDKIYLYTDGVTEATRGDKVLYGEDRLLSFLNKNKTTNLEATLKGVKSDIDTFVEGADQFDDITMLAVEFLGK